MAETLAERGDARRPERDSPPDEPSSAVGDTFTELRSLIVGPEQRELLKLRAHVLDPSVQVRDVSRVLPDAIAMRANDPQLTRALAPSIEEALTASVRRDPRPLADALFPVMGPAIRKAIVHTLAAMMDSLNRTVEQSLSWRAVQWRWTALRTGKPFAEIVLLNTLQYRVEQVFLIHRETGLLLQHVSSEVGGAQDADQISAMLTAIRDFVSDSFKTGGDDSLDALRVGDVSVVVEQGPRAVLAGVIRGTAPASVRSLLQDALESIHLQFGAELESFQGDAAPFERARPILESCLVSQFRQPQKRASYRRWAIATAVILLAVGVWAFLGLRERRRWDAYVERVRAEPGIVVVSAGRRGGRFAISGLRDPLARDPAALLAESGLRPESIDGRWEPYQAMSAAFVTARAQRLLRPPPGVTLAFDDGVLTAAGSASPRWLVESERLAPAIAGVRTFSFAGTPAEVQLKDRIEALTVRFPKGQSRLVPGQEATISLAAALLSELNEAMRVRGLHGRVEIHGHTDSDGTDVSNGPLSQARADAVLGLLRLPAFDALEVATQGVGSTAPLVSGTGEADKERNRRASFHVTIAGAAARSGRS